MKFSICIPNYNYARFLGRTLQSVLGQSFADLEVVVSDNCSTDDSVAVASATGDSRVRVHCNRANVGFAGNLDRAASRATGDWMILLSSDDLMFDGALAAYAAVAAALGERAGRTVLCSSVQIVDENDVLGEVHAVPRHAMFRPDDVSPELSRIAGGETYRLSSGELLRRALGAMQNPLFFCATAYPRELYQRIEGYGGGRSVGPDKWFNWRLLGAADEVVFIRRPLFGYRWHSANQSAQQSASGALKFLVDDYANSFEIDRSLLERAGLSRQDVERAFIEYDVVRHGLALLAEQKRVSARRTLRFGQAAYPGHLARNPRAWAFRALLTLGPLGSFVARRLRRKYAEA
jgi:glycosyltransferase involved in cell wall biosynthesis